ncbi:NAD-dependent epimerase/dehydratase [Beutenbergia cavernae DSM 12333]|uniref:NAD-dependent epimerase/dehydratase n=1 Tax=Beutenbergia cavernae (strain ATCC BAA-8 / DSM 12333 / CCUG 43141 / JCM 11478 / NBRC 16432 / NCIMB 13614 / HKI 0122) TaxID=471853 RepID=C5BYH9_BEUC1|nr:SDR family oxidoreductase [Beutenbergia cavernae]ACQ78937.1 NAD-dependent epimerase/dehydratase [Beutenbergia cavernae DSM 12333]
MAQIAIVGGHGKIARLLIPLLVARGDTPVALIRNPEHAPDVRDAGGVPRLLDIEAQDAAAFAGAFGRADAVVFAAGAGPDGRVDRKTSVDLQGALKSIEGARSAGVRRFVQVSAIGVDEPVGDDATEVWAAYVAAKRDADAALRDSGLEWTIIRPARLTDSPGTGLVSLARSLPGGEVPRADVAAVLATVLGSPSSVGHQWDLVGGTTPVLEAVATAIEAERG